MTEIADSFCERCGTRYSFNPAQPKRRPVRSARLFAKAAKHFVMSDGTTVEEAVALARNDIDRDVSVEMTEAFHKTFNFCMRCRQYTCQKCWNEREAACLSCAPTTWHDEPAGPTRIDRPAIPTDIGIDTPVPDSRAPQVPHVPAAHPAAAGARPVLPPIAPPIAAGRTGPAGASPAWPQTDLKTAAREQSPLTARRRGARPSASQPPLTPATSEPATTASTDGQPATASLAPARAVAPASALEPAPLDAEPRTLDAEEPRFEAAPDIFVPGPFDLETSEPEPDLSPAPVPELAVAESPAPEPSSAEAPSPVAAMPDAILFEAAAKAETAGGAGAPEPGVAVPSDGPAEIDEPAGFRPTTDQLAALESIRDLFTDELDAPAVAPEVAAPATPADAESPELMLTPAELAIIAAELHLHEEDLYPSRRLPAQIECVAAPEPEMAEATVAETEAPASIEAAAVAAPPELGGPAGTAEPGTASVERTETQATADEAIESVAVAAEIVELETASERVEVAAAGAAGFEPETASEPIENAAAEALEPELEAAPAPVVAEVRSSIVSRLLRRQTAPAPDAASAPPERIGDAPEQAWPHPTPWQARPRTARATRTSGGTAPGVEVAAVTPAIAPEPTPAAPAPAPLAAPDDLQAEALQEPEATVAPPAAVEPAVAETAAAAVPETPSPEPAPVAAPPTETPAAEPPAAERPAPLAQPDAPRPFARVLGWPPAPARAPDPARPIAPVPAAQAPAAPAFVPPPAVPQPPGPAPAPAAALYRPAPAVAPTQANIWAESAREVISRSTSTGSSVRSCQKCQLPLSTNARFCRRCGTPQTALEPVGAGR